MFENTWGWIKSHPFILVGGIGAVVLIFVVTRSNGGGGGQVVAGYQNPSDAAVQAGAAVSMAQIQAGAQSGQLQAQLAAQQSEIAATVTIKGMEAQIARFEIEQQANVANTNVMAQATTASFLGGLTANVQIAGIQSQQAIAEQTLLAQVNMASIQASTDQTRIRAVTDITNAPYNLQIAQLESLGQGGLERVLHHAEGTKNSYVSVGGITAGRNTVPSNFGAALRSALGGLGGAIAAII